MVKGVIFDVDGVLVDNSHIHIEAFEKFCNMLGVELPIDALMANFGKGNDDIMPLVLPTELLAQKSTEEWGNIKEKIYRDIFEETIMPTPGLVDFLHAVREGGYKTAVGSSGSLENVEFVLRKCGIKELFDAVVNGDMVALRKPAPDIYLLAARKLGLEPSQCVVIEDAHAGVISAHTAGAKAIGLTTSFPKEIVEQWNCELVAADFSDFSVKTLEQLNN